MNISRTNDQEQEQPKAQAPVLDPETRYRISQGQGQAQAHAKTEPTKVEPAKAESAKVEPTHAGPEKVESAKVEPVKADSAKVELTKAEKMQDVLNPFNPKPSRSEAPAQAEPSKYNADVFRAKHPLDSVPEQTPAKQAMEQKYQTQRNQAWAERYDKAVAGESPKLNLTIPADRVAEIHKRARAFSSEFKNTTRPSYTPSESYQRAQGIMERAREIALEKNSALELRTKLIQEHNRGFKGLCRKIWGSEIKGMNYVNSELKAARSREIGLQVEAHGTVAAQKKILSLEKQEVQERAKLFDTAKELNSKQSWADKLAARMDNKYFRQWGLIVDKKPMKEALERFNAFKEEQAAWNAYRDPKLLEQERAKVQEKEAKAPVAQEERRETQAQDKGHGQRKINPVLRPQETAQIMNFAKLMQGFSQLTIAEQALAMARRRGLFDETVPAI